jgi:hypothetical protein
MFTQPLFEPGLIAQYNSPSYVTNSFQLQPESIYMMSATHLPAHDAYPTPNRLIISFSAQYPPG